MNDRGLNCDATSMENGKKKKRSLDGFGRDEFEWKVWRGLIKG